MPNIKNPLDWDLEDEENKESIDAAHAKQYELDVHFLRTFSTPSGKIVLDHLISNTRGAGTWLVSIAMQHSMEAACAHGFAREGQNALIDNITQRIERARNYELKAKPTKKGK